MFEEIKNGSTRFSIGEDQICEKFFFFLYFNEFFFFFVLKCFTFFLHFKRNMPQCENDKGVYPLLN